MQTKKPEPQPKSGYVVHLGDNHYLSRSFRTVRHTDRPRSTRGVERAWVHPPESLLMGGEWTKRAKAVIPAFHDRHADVTRITGEAIPFAEFIEVTT